MNYIPDFYCYECMSTKGKKIHITETINKSGKTITIPNVPIRECTECGEQQIEYEGMEMIERAINAITAAQ